MASPRSKRGSENSWRVGSDAPRLFDHGYRVLELNDAADVELKRKGKKKTWQVVTLCIFIYFFLSVWSEVTTAAQVDSSLLPGELIIPPPPQAHVWIPRSLQTLGQAWQGDTNCPLMRIFGTAGRGRASPVHSRPFWRQRSQSSSRSFCLLSSCVFHFLFAFFLLCFFRPLLLLNVGSLNKELVVVLTCKGITRRS